MKKIIEVVCFSYGFLASLIAATVYVCVLLRRPLASLDLWQIEALFLTYGLVLVITAYRRPSRPLWTSIFLVTPARVRFARLMLGVITANFGLWMIGLFVSHSLGETKDDSTALAGFFACFALVNAVYITIHWAYRPENIFSPSVMRFAANPLLFAFSSRYRRQPGRYEYRVK